ncbi:MAG: hypothetical protein WBE18_03155 [Gammaproteobacteria bacterium]
MKTAKTFFNPKPTSSKKQDKELKEIGNWRDWRADKAQCDDALNLAIKAIEDREDICRKIKLQAKMMGLDLTDKDQADIKRLQTAIGGIKQTLQKYKLEEKVKYFQKYEKKQLALEAKAQLYDNTLTMKR